MAIPTYNERSGVEFTAVFEDEQGTPALPASVHWRLTCETTGRVMQDWTEAAAVNGGTSVTADIELSGPVLTLCESQNQRELKSLLIVADKDGEREYSEEYQFYVRKVRR